MPGSDHCCAVNCTNRRGKAGCEGVKFYRIPKNNESRRTWLGKIHRRDLTEASLTDNIRLCSVHFHNGVKTSEQPLPVYFSHCTYPLARVKRKREHSTIDSDRKRSRKSDTGGTTPTQTSATSISNGAQEEQGEETLAACQG